MQRKFDDLREIIKRLFHEKIFPAFLEVLRRFYSLLQYLAKNLRYTQIDKRI